MSAEPRDQVDASDDAASPNYTLGHGQDLISGLSQRKATREAAFFLPYLRSSMSLLDCGCGPGSITIELAAIVALGRVVGIDIASEQFDIGRERASERGLSNVTFEQGDLRALPFADASFDAVFAHGVLYHLSDPKQALAEMRRVLVPGGVLGIRDSDEGGTIFTPSDLQVERGAAALLEAARLNGSNLHFGRTQRASLREAGFDSIRLSASYDCFASPAATRGLGRFLAELILQPHMQCPLLRSGWATEAELQQMSDALRRWGEHPDAFWARARCEAVAVRC